MIEKVENLKQMLRPGVVTTDEEMIDLVKGYRWIEGRDGEE